MVDSSKQFQLPDRVKVFARERPFLDNSGDDTVQVGSQSCQCATKAAHKWTENVQNFSSNASRKGFTFDGVFPQNASQESVYSTLAQPMSSDVICGIHACFLAYSQTGSG